MPHTGNIEQWLFNFALAEDCRCNSPLVSFKCRVHLNCLKTIAAVRTSYFWGKMRAPQATDLIAASQTTVGSHVDLTTTILLVLGLYMVQLFLQETSRFGFDLRAIIGNRDNAPPLSIVGGRLERAKNNMLESLPLFLGLALLAVAKGHTAGLVANAATVFLIARAAYVPAYVSGIPMLRSAVWLVAVASLGAMAWALT